MRGYSYVKCAGDAILCLKPPLSRAKCLSAAIWCLKSGNFRTKCGGKSIRCLKPIDFRTECGGKSIGCLKPPLSRTKCLSAAIWCLKSGDFRTECLTMYVCTRPDTLHPLSVADSRPAALAPEKGGHQLAGRTAGDCCRTPHWLPKREGTSLLGGPPATAATRQSLHFRVISVISGITPMRRGKIVSPSPGFT